MNFEALETLRVEHITKVLETMKTIMDDPKSTNEDKIRAGALVDAISGDIIKAYLSAEVLVDNKDTKKSLINQIDKLNRDHEE
jgi:hypothetical protein